MINGELGSFLRARRETVRPEDVGLPRGERRRTPGLRRSEVATLAGISVEYLTRLEQGRDRHPSTQVVAAVAGALRLEPSDRQHLHELVALSQGTELVCGDGCPGETPIPDGLLTLLDRLEPTPAVLVARSTDLVAWNDAFAAMTRPMGMLVGDPPNMARYALTDHRASEAVVDWDAFADAMVAWLHRHGGPDTADVVEELADAVGETFTRRWERRPTGAPDLGLRTLVHPEVGRIRTDHQVLAASDGLSLVAQLPADDAAAEAFDRLTGRRPGALRQVSL